MAIHRLIHGYAPGSFWGPNIRSRIEAERVSQKVLSANFDKNLAMSLPFAVWLEATNILTNTTKCSCYKDTAEQPDVPCNICYGTGYTPGYVKVGTKNYWASCYDAGWTLTNIDLDKTNRPFRFQLSSGQVTGTAISANITVSTTGKVGAWQYNTDAFTRDGGVASSYNIEVSKDNGAIWGPMSDLNVLPVPSTVRFRITLSRNSTSVKSPMFEIVRIRFPTIGDIYKGMTGKLNEPVVRFIPTWDKGAEQRANYGLALDRPGKRFWTMPLSFFDSSITRPSDGEYITQDCLVECRYGKDTGGRFIPTELNVSETFHEFTHQEFALRRAVGSPGSKAGEYIYKIW